MSIDSEKNRDIQHYKYIYIFLQVAVHKIRYWDPDWQKSLSFLLTSTNRRYYNSKTVDELLFSGYTDNLLTMSKVMPMDDVPTYDRFGWFYMVRLLIKIIILFSNLFLAVSENKKNHYNGNMKLNTLKTHKLTRRLIICTII